MKPIPGEHAPGHLAPLDLVRLSQRYFLDMPLVIGAKILLLVTRDQHG